MVSEPRLRVATLAEFPEGSARLTEMDGKPVCVFRTTEGVFATEEMCPHRAGPLSEGKIEGNTVTCPWHKAKFDVTTGKVLYGPVSRDLKTYPVEIDQDVVFLVPAASSTP